MCAEDKYFGECGVEGRVALAEFHYAPTPRVDEDQEADVKIQIGQAVTAGLLSTFLVYKPAKTASVIFNTQIPYW